MKTRKILSPSQEKTKKSDAKICQHMGTDNVHTQLVLAFTSTVVLHPKNWANLPPQSAGKP
jgi:hypothetical protein